MSESGVSVIIPTYNRAHLLGRALTSALSQLDRDDEIIIVDDDSTDDTEAVVSRFGGPVYYHRIKNRGAGVARNFGIRKSRKDLIAFLDSDDEWMPGKLDMQRRLLTQCPDVLFCFSDFAVKTAAGVEHRQAIRRWLADFRSWDELVGPGQTLQAPGQSAEQTKAVHFHVGNIFLLELSVNCILTSTLLVRRKAAGEALHFAEDTATFEDWECFGRLAQKGTAAYLDTETAWQHGHAGVRLTDADLLKSARARLTVTERVWGTDEGFLRSHGDLYRQVIDEQRLIIAGEQIAAGETGAARLQLLQMTSAPLPYRILAAMPGPLARTVLEIRKRLVR